MVKTFIAGGAIGHRRYVKFGAADGTVLQAAAATDAVIGVTDCPGGVATGDRVDVVLLGVTDVEFGGTVARGGLLVSDASGKAVAAAPASGANVFVGGRALVSAVSGDIVPAFVNPGQIQGA
ncbi:DUF2190 family protein [Ancylobacter lacus]|nr:DUF2190 family protein [Ancylobacter lacus]